MYLKAGMLLNMVQSESGQTTQSNQKAKAVVKTTMYLLNYPSRNKIWDRDEAILMTKDQIRYSTHRYVKRHNL
jgi:hypothetical protein